MDPLIDEIVREGARRMLAAALEAEVSQYIAELSAERDGAGRRPVVRNGYHQPRTVVTAAGPVEVKAPRVNDRRIDEATGGRKRFSSRILPPWCRKSPKISEVLPLLYLHGLSSGDFVPALEQFLGSAAGLGGEAENPAGPHRDPDPRGVRGREKMQEQARTRQVFMGLRQSHDHLVKSCGPCDSRLSGEACTYPDGAVAISDSGWRRGRPAASLPL